jgi:hypothetical protein
VDQIDTDAWHHDCSGLTTRMNKTTWQDGRRLALTALGALAGCGGHSAKPDAARITDAGGVTVSQHVVFMMTGGKPAGPDGSSEIGLVNLDGTALDQVTHDGAYKFLPHFSPDGTKLVYSKYSVGGYGSPNARADIAVYDFATGTETMVSSGGENVQGTWGPDSRRIAYLHGDLSKGMDAIWIVNADGSNAHEIAHTAGTVEDPTFGWGDLAWSRQEWILFTVFTDAQTCFRVRTEKILSDGSSRTKVSDGGPSCTPHGAQQYGDADPGWSADGSTIYSSRGLPGAVANAPPDPQLVARHLYAFSSAAWTPGKIEMDLSQKPECIEGVPKGSPDGKRILVTDVCFEPQKPPGSAVYWSDSTGSGRSLVIEGFGGDWNPAAH